MLHRLLDLLYWLIGVYQLIIFVHTVLSWFVHEGSVYDTLSKITSPILEPCYRLQEKLIPNSPIDFSPAVAILLLELVKRII